jgi:excisionase family DNA binding protein
MGDRIAFTIEQAVEVSGIGRTTLYAQIRDGHLIARKIGRRTIIMASDLLAFLESLPEVGEARD